jgi:hypothetical protein
MLASEEIIQHLIAADQAKIYWILTKPLNDPYHDAGLFVSDLKKLESTSQIL